MSQHEESAFELDPVLHQPLRTQVVAYLAGRGTATFTELKKVVQASDGNLESHLKKLIAAEYVATSKDTINNRPQTLYSLTDSGCAALKRYLASMEKVLDFARHGQEQAGDEEKPGVNWRRRPAL